MSAGMLKRDAEIVREMCCFTDFAPSPKYICGSGRFAGYDI
jgi:hypothetical protein